MRSSPLPSHWSAESKMKLVHSCGNFIGRPALFCAIFTQSSGLFLFYLPFVILQELPAPWCITYPTRTRHSAGKRCHPGSSVEQNDSWPHFFRLPPPRCVTGYTTLILSLLCCENFHGGIFPQNEAAFVRFPNKMNFVFSKFMVVSLA